MIHGEKGEKIFKMSNFLPSNLLNEEDQTSFSKDISTEEKCNFIMEEENQNEKEVNKIRYIIPFRFSFRILIYMIMRELSSIILRLITPIVIFWILIRTILQLIICFFWTIAISTIAMVYLLNSNTTRLTVVCLCSITIIQHMFLIRIT